MTVFPKAKFAEEKVVSDGGLCISCVPSGAGLKPALSAVPFASSAPENIKAVYFAKGINTYFVCAESGVYFSKTNEFFARIATYRDNVFAFEFLYNDKPCAVLCMGNGSVRYSAEGFSTVPVNADLCAGAYHCGRLFAIDSDNKNKLVWSETGGFTEWGQALDKGGYLNLDPERGETLDVVCFDGRLVLVRKYGLTVLNMFGSPENYSVGITDTACPEIYKNTAVSVGGKLLFFTREGLCSFDGSRIESLKSDIIADVYDGTCAASYAGRYFLACKSKRLDRAVVLGYCVADGESCITDCAAEALCASGGVYAYSGGKVYKLEESDWQYTSEPLGFGTHSRKTLKEITFKGVADVAVSCGDKTRLYSAARGIVRPGMRGKYFTVKISGEGEVGDIVAKAEVSVGI